MVGTDGIILDRKPYCDTCLRERLKPVEQIEDLEEDFDVKACNDEFDRVQAQIELAMNPPINFKGERMYVAETDGTFDPSDIRPGGARFLLKGPDYKAKYEELQKAYIVLNVSLCKQIDQTQDVIDKYMALADKYSELVDKHTELKKG
jgi:hypothetical protein